MCETQSRGLKWERAVLVMALPIYTSNGMLTLVMVAIVTVCLSYTRFHRTELGLGLGWGYSVLSVRLIHTLEVTSVKLAHT